MRVLCKRRGERLRTGLARIGRNVEKQRNPVVQGQEGLPLGVGDADEIAERLAEVRKAGQELFGGDAVEQVGDGGGVGGRAG